MSKLNLHGALLGAPMLLVLIAGGCAHADRATPESEAAPAAEQSAAAPEAEPSLTANEQEARARAEWEEWKARHTWEERLELMGLEEDPGPEPDPERVWSRSGQQYMIQRFSKETAVFHDTDMGWVRPLRGVTFAAEIYRDDEESVWVWMPVTEQQNRSSVRATREYPVRDLSEEHRTQYLELKEEFEPLTPPESDEVIRFVESSEGLPQSGSWRNSPAVADINGDGHLDIIAPPQRGDFFASGPRIFLGDGAGNWSVWKNVEWPNRSLDYGAVRAADFNGDGHLDLAFGVHLKGVAVYLHDGAGRFTDSSEGLAGTKFPTRRIEIADVDADGFPDVVALTEGPNINIREPRKKESKMRIFRNRQGGSKWEEYQIGEPIRGFGGDWLATGNFNGDPYPDFVASSIYFHGTDVIWVSTAEMEWVPFGRGFLPPFSYIGAVSTGKISSPGLDDAIVSFTRFWNKSVNPEEVPHPEITKIAGIDLLSFVGGEPVRKPLIRWPSSAPTWAMAVGDVNGDGNEDIVYIRTQPQENGVLLGDGAGNFRRSRVEGWEEVPNVAYDLSLADVDRNGLLDIIVMYERLSGQQQGSIRVHLNRTGAERGEGDRR